MDVLVYLESWLDEMALIERFNVDKERIIIRYENFLLINLKESEESALKSMGATIVPLQDKKKICFGDCDNTRQHFSTVESKLDPEKSLVWIVQFVGPIKCEWITALQDIGAQTYGDIQPYSIFAYMSLNLVRKLKNENLKVNDETVIEWIGRHNHQIKVHADCKDHNVIHYFPWDIHETCDHKCIKHTDLSQSEGILYIHPYIEPKLCNAGAALVLNTNAAHTQGITGLNEIVAITDTGIYKAHEMFSGNLKIVNTIDIAGDANGSGGDGDGHGTHVAGSVANQAFNAKLIMVKVFDNQGAWAAGDKEYDFWKKAYLAGARVNNNSWGSESAGAYHSTDRDADKICVENPDYILCVANGNEGPNPRTVGSPAVAKNVISVGACVTLTSNDLAYFSSRGPTIDGRIKPDVVAPGTTITSAKFQTTTGYTEMQGTSMATPQISGVSALVRQYFIEGKYPTVSGTHNPSSALVKAMLINGAVEMLGNDADRQREHKFPNNSQGWGRVDVSRTLPFGSSNRIVKAWDITTAPTTGNKWVSTFTVETATEVKITLTWIDPPAIPGSTSNLVNNLNLRVITPDNKIFLGNNFIGLNPGYSVPGGIPDSKNNVEGVCLKSGYSFGSGVNIPAGVYTVEVISSYMSPTNIGFALVAGIENVVIPPSNQIHVAVMGDYNSQLAIILRDANYLVDSYTYTDYTNLLINIQKYKAVILNRVSDAIGFDNLIKINIPIIFLGAYPFANHAVGVLSKRTKNPGLVDNKWKNGAVKLKINRIHPIFDGYTIGTILTIVNGGNNDYQTYDGFTGTNIASNGMNSGLPQMVGILETPKRVLLSSLGVSTYTNTTHWTVQGKTVFMNTVKWIVD
jgi:subtilisin family serine protease